MTPTNIETSTDARSKSRVELAPTMPCKKEEDLRSTREARQAYVREKWECMHNCELCGKCHILKGRDAETLYAEYIEGKMSYMEITLEIRGAPDKPCGEDARMLTQKLLLNDT